MVLVSSTSFASSCAWPLVTVGTLTSAHIIPTLSLILKPPSAAQCHLATVCWGNHFAHFCSGSPTSPMMVYLEQNNYIMKTHQWNQCFKLYIERSRRTKGDTGDNAPSVFPTEHVLRWWLSWGKLKTLMLQRTDVGHLGVVNFTQTITTLTHFLWETLQYHEQNLN